jgi:hypothetical protein
MPEPFPEELIRPRHGSLTLSGPQPTIAIELEPFVIDGEKVEQSLDFQLEISTCDLSQLAGKTFEFPSNPDDGYVEGSIYIWSVHNPIDLHSVAFEDSDGDTVSATLDMTFVFEFEGDRKNLRMKIPIRFDVQNS